VSELALFIGDVVVETSMERAAAERLPAVLREAFALLSERLAGVPATQWPRLADRVVAALTVELDSPDALFEPRGAMRLADGLYARLMSEIA
jgi:hypothetical protein